MSRVNQAQMMRLLDLLSEDGVLVRGKVSYVNITRQNFWKRIALQLNSVEGGVYKNTWKWCKMWADWKNKTKKKANIFLYKKKYCYGQLSVVLSSLELRLLKMIEYPMDEKADFSNIEMVSKTEMPVTITDDFLSEDYGTYDTHLNQNPMSSDEEDNKVLRSYANVGEITPDDRNKFQECGESSDIGDKVKMKGKKFKKKKGSLEELQVRTTLALEKKRVQQKSEELRLRAVELKLKGDELRLKEIEINKINYLTNIEEEKLKCFKDISSSLKELLDCTMSANIRFHNVL